MEILYCSFMNIFGIVDADSLVWDDPLYPFMVYGIGVLVCAIALVPLLIQLVKRRKTMWGAALEYFVITVLVCMAMELAMGFLLNQPDAAGNYPLWDNSQLPGNIFGPGVDRERHRPGRLGHAVHVNHLPAVPKGAGKSAHPRHAPGCCNRCCGLCGAVRGEILVSTATPPHVWQRFPKLAAENATTLGIIRIASQQLLRADAAQRYRKERIVTFTVFPVQDLFSPVTPTILLGLSFITRAGYR